MKKGGPNLRTQCASFVQSRVNVKRFTLLCLANYVVLIKMSNSKATTSDWTWTVCTARRLCTDLLSHNFSTAPINTPNVQGSCSNVLVAQALPRSPRKQIFEHRREFIQRRLLGLHFGAPAFLSALWRSRLDGLNRSLQMRYVPMF